MKIPEWIRLILYVCVAVLPVLDRLLYKEHGLQPSRTNDACAIVPSHRLHCCAGPNEINRTRTSGTTRMKRALLAITCAALCGCETITSEDGTTTTRFDAKSASDVINTGFSTYDRYQRQSQIVGYMPDGTPVYRQQ